MAAEGKVEISELAVLGKDDLGDDSYVRTIYNVSEIRVLGKGAFGKVILGERMQGNDKIRVAVKVLETYDQNLINESFRELMNLTLLKDHENIMGLKEHRLNTVVQKKRVLFQLFIEMAVAESTLERVITKKGRLVERDVLGILKDLCSGLLFAHERKVAHLDLKPENILVSGGTFQIGDWGGSLRLKSTESTVVKSQMATTPGYDAPELDGQNYGDKDKYNFYRCDVYSMGMIALRMCGVEYKSLNSIPKAEVMRKLHDAALDLLFDSIKGVYSSILLEIIRRMTTYDSESRISVKEILKFIEGL